MEWNVYFYNVNHQKIETFNIFNHRYFTGYVKQHLQTCTDKDSFAEELKSELRYYFWSKSEWEIIIKPWVGNKTPGEEKIDIYAQVMLNFNIFLDYIWNNREEFLNEFR